MTREERPRTPPWLALLAVVFMWTSADGARRADGPPPRPPAGPVAIQTSLPLRAAHHAHPMPDLR